MKIYIIVMGISLMLAGAGMGIELDRVSRSGQVQLIIESEGSEQWLTLRTSDGSFTRINITPMIRHYIDQNLLPRKECL